ncbi:4Fe-4S ferredoxin iron-sulfur binding domain protein, partial [gut metagenome]
MEKSTVYFTDLRTRPGYNLLDKLNRLLTAAGFDEMEWEERFVAIKIHFGEPGNRFIPSSQLRKGCCRPHPLAGRQAIFDRLQH